MVSAVFMKILFTKSKLILKIISDLIITYMMINGCVASSENLSDNQESNNEVENLRKSTYSYMKYEETDYTRDPYYYKFTVSSMDVNLSNSNNLECFLLHKYCTISDQILFSDKLCTCTSDCIKYGDCCWDAVDYQINSKNDVLFECVSLDEEYVHTYFMISYCPFSWIDSETKSLCEKINLYQNDPLLYVPVTSVSTFNVYRNIFCAICNDVSDAKAWITYQECDDADPLCLTKFVPPPESLQVPKLCDWRGIFECREDSLRQKCAIYYAPVQYKDYNGITHMYKNKFCAFCSGLRADQLECGSLDGFVGLHGRRKQAKSLAVMLDVDFSKGGTIVGTKKRCHGGQIYDPWKKKCRLVFCGKLFHYKNGKCLKWETYSRNVHERINIFHNYTLNSSCLKISIDASNFSLLENGTIILKNKDGKVLLPGTYELYPNSTILICVPQENNIYKFSLTHSYLTILCLSISIICLIIKLILFIFLSEYRKLPMIIVFFLSFSLLLAQVLFLAESNITTNSICIGVAISMHYFYLTSIFCTNALAFDIWKTFTTLKKISTDFYGRHLVYNILYCWGLPIIIIISSVISEWAYKSTYSPQYGVHHCWISNRFALLVYFAAPLALVLTINIIFFIMTAISIYKTSKSSKIARKSANVKKYVRFILYVKIALIMGFSWIFGFVSAYFNNEWLWYIFIIFNGLQGVFILFSFNHIRNFKKYFKNFYGCRTLDKSSSKFSEDDENSSSV